MNLLRAVLTAALLGCLALTACGGEKKSGGGEDAKADAPAAVKTCDGKELTLTGAPRRVVTLDGGAAGFLNRLGVADTVVGTGAPDFFTAYPAAEQAELKKIKVVGKMSVTKEALAQAKPDLVLATSQMSFGAFPGSPKPADVEQIGAKPFAACSAKEGKVEDLEATYDFIANLGALFDVSDRADGLESELRDREQAVVDRVADKEPVPALVLGDAPAPGQPIGTRGAGGTANALIELAGGENVAQTPSDLARLSAEQIVESNPEVIVLQTGFSPKKPAQIKAEIAKHPVLKKTKAVRDKRFIEVPWTPLVTASVLNVDVLETLADGFHPDA